MLQHSIICENPLLLCPFLFNHIIANVTHFETELMIIIKILVLFQYNSLGEIEKMRLTRSEIFHAYFPATYSLFNIHKHFSSIHMQYIQYKSGIYLSLYTKRGKLYIKKSNNNTNTLISYL